ncbi:HNH endonuclease [Salmonella enterica subsp. enterica serovar Abony]|nr:HNH endonuclease [Salmonella enterica subsp. enterica serovar Abony]EBY6401345.1 HNH endonuclease [Salmonella enterica subsp. enterica serovar Abony]EDH1237973.1 hypothetical protein [Salmonella enterica subsp. enterica]EHK4822077.1 HNH endonuclease [Salmonella enterica subsp. enterica serovar Abony]MKM01991.1 HNH endonuclease [Salmonella enterica subsp. enterica serovar Isaszeg]
MHNWNEIFYVRNGKLHWKIKPAARVKAGDVAGYLTCTGYMSVERSGRQYQVHRIIWEMHNGEIPNGYFIDHINHNRIDNRIENLRLVTSGGNAKNRSRPNTNTSGVTGVHWNKRLNKWHVQINHEGKRKHIGLFDSIEKAAEARKDAISAFGYHKNHGA